jgi:parallel beta-helix repeat protein
MRVWVFILVFLILATSPVLASAQCTPPASGDWLVNETVLCSGENIVMNGNLLINGSGDLTLENSRLQFNSTSDGEYGVEVNGSFVAEGSTIESLSNSYTFVSKVGANLEIRNSYIHGCGYSSLDSKETGVYVKSDGSNITNTTFSFNYLALVVNSDNNEISNNNIFSNYGGLVSDGSGNVITGNTIKGNSGGGISAIVGENMFFEHNVIEDNTGSGFPEMLLNDSVINNNTFVNNTGGGFGVMGDDNNITNNIINSNGGMIAGLEVIDSGNTRVTGNTILGNNNHGLYLYRTKNTLVKDNLCNLSNQYDIFMLSAEDTTFENTNYTTLVEKWYLDVTVVDMDSDPVEDADVVIRDSFEDTVFSGDTDSQGSIAQQTLDERIKNESGTFDFNPHSINVTKSGYYDNFTTFSLISDLSLQLALNATPGPPPPPPGGNFTFTITSPENKTYVQKDLVNSTELELRVTSQTNISSCDYSVENATGTVSDSGSLSEVNSKTFRTYLNVSGMQGSYEAIFDCDSLEDVTNSSSIAFTVYPSRECLVHGDCAGTQICTNWNCVELTCVCGYAENHDCVYYECCGDNDCEDNEVCETDTNTCELVNCPCPEKRYDHECNMEVGYCCSDLQCAENETCVDNECIERTLSFAIPEDLVFGKNISILVLDQNSYPVSVVKIIVKYLDTDPLVTETYYTDSEGVAEIPIKHAGRVEFVARKQDYFLSHQSGNVPEPFNWLFVLQIVILIGAVAGIVIIWLKFLKGGLPGRGPLKLEKTVSGGRVMLRVKNRTGKKIQDITIRDSVPRGAFMRCNVTPRIERFDRATDLLTWEILELDPKEEVIIEYDTRRTNKGFSVKFGGKEYKG